MWLKLLLASKEITTHGDDQNTIAHSLTTCDKVEGVGVPVNSEKTQLTDFRNESCDDVTVCGVAYKRSEGFNREPTLQNIRQYLARPVRIINAPWTYVTRTLALTTTIGSGLYPIAAIAQGAYGFRATFCFRLQVAATPFQAGVIRMFWQPQVASTDVNFRGNYANQVSMLPGVNLDLCEQTSAILRVPFVSSYNYYPIDVSTGLVNSFYNTTDISECGTLGLFSYLPLSIAAGASNPTINVFSWLEDVELLSASRNAFVTATPQGGSEDIKVNTPLATMLGAASRVVSTYGGLVPMISSYAGPTAWMLRQAQKLASAFGWAKAFDVTTIQRVQQTNNTYQQNCDGYDVIYNAGLFSDNQVAVDAGFAGSDIDEMAFDYIFSVPSLVSNGSLLTTDTIDTLKYAAEVCPKAFWYNSFGGVAINRPYLPPAPANQVLLTTPLFYMGCFASYWQGDIKFTIRFAKTKFHTGRYLLAFNPGWGAFGTGVASVKAPDSYRYNEFKGIVIDLREGNVFEYIVPFVSPVSYNLVNQGTGIFTMTCLDPLVCPSTVSQSVPFAVEVSAMPGFQFASFHGPSNCPAPLTGNSVYSQAGTELIASQVSSMDAGVCMGERVTSVKQLINKACPDSIATGAAKLPIAPFWVYDYSTWGGATTLAGTGFTSSTHMGRCLALMYSYARGSTILDCIKTGATASTPSAKMYAYFKSAYEHHTVNLGGSDINASSDMILSETDSLHIRIPFFSPTSRVLRADQRGYPTQSGLGPNGGLYTCANTQYVNFTRAADDAQLGYFIGTPLVTCDEPNPTAQDSALFSGSFCGVTP